jgi:hypothetical protein
MESLRVQTIAATVVILMGVLHVTYMISVEGELGAIPLLLLVVGAAWLTLTRVRVRSLGRRP